MKCQKCGSEWNSKVKSRECPFCSAPLAEKHEESIEAVLKYIVNTEGEEIYNRTLALIGMISDLLPKATDERQLIKHCLNSGMVKELLLMKGKDETEIEIIQKKVSKNLQEHCFLNETMANKVVYWISFSLGIEKVSCSKSTPPIEKTIYKNCDSNETENIYFPDLEEEKLKELCSLLKNIPDENSSIIHSNALNRINYVGKRIDGRYNVEEVIEVAEVGVIYKAYDEIEERYVAIKIFHQEFLTNKDFCKNLRNKAKPIAMLSTHPDFVKVFVVATGDRLQYMVMEYVEGMTIKEYLRELGKFDVHDTIQIMISILTALQYACDNGFIFDVIQPHDIMLLPDGSIKIIDFEVYGCDFYNRCKNNLMSPNYVAPELLNKEKANNANIYSLGVIMYEMLMGEPPFSEMAPLTISNMKKMRVTINPNDAKNIPNAICEIIMHMIQPFPEIRYKSATEIINDLKMYEQDQSAKLNYSIDDLNQLLYIQQKEEKVRTWKEKGLCPYCGGTFKGLFTKKCSLCGTLKDY